MTVMVIIDYDCFHGDLPWGSQHACIPLDIGLGAVQAGAGSSLPHAVAKVEDPAKNSKRITDWVKSIGDLQKVWALLFRCFGPACTV